VDLPHQPIRPFARHYRIRRPSFFQHRRNRAQIQQHQVIVGAPGNQSNASPLQGSRQGLGIGDNLGRVLGKAGLQGFSKGHRLAGNDMLQRPPLTAGEHRLIQLFAQLWVAGENEPSTRPAQRLVGGGGHHIAEGHRVGVVSGGHQAGNMGNVGQQISSHLVGNGAESGKVDCPRIGRVAADDQLGPVLQGQIPHLVKINPLRLRMHPVVHHAEPLAGDVYRGAVGKVAAVGQIHAHNCVSWLQQGQENSEIGLRPRVGLHIGVGCPEQLLSPVNGQLFNLVNKLAAAVVALARQPFCILVGEHRALGGQDGRRGEVLAGNHLQVIPLPVELFLDQAVNNGIRFRQDGQAIP
jgi:hypothetical protein